jgi:hypothetical protein
MKHFPFCFFSIVYSRFIEDDSLMEFIMLAFIPSLVVLVAFTMNNNHNTDMYCFLFAGAFSGILSCSLPFSLFYSCPLLLA